MQNGFAHAIAVPIGQRQTAGTEFRRGPFTFIVLCNGRRQQPGHLFGHRARQQVVAVKIQVHVLEKRLLPGNSGRVVRGQHTDGIQAIHALVG
ncbi:MAG: hypothetical protein DME18_06795, partial [Verrucomicrobia bacterium]